MSAIGVARARNGATARSPACTSPAWTSIAITTGRPWCSGAMNGSGGAGITLAIVVSSSGAASASTRKEAITSGVAGRKSSPPTIWPTSCRRNFSRVATPKFPPPPRSAQNRSGWLSASARSSSPSAVTTSAASRSSMVMPCLRTRNPIPPLSVIPPTPTVPASPKPVARPCSPAAAVYSPAVRPVSAQAVRLSASISSPRIADRSSTIPPSETPWPAGLWPPLRTASSDPVSRASETTRATSAASAARTIMPGRRSIAPAKTVRASS